MMALRDYQVDNLIAVCSSFVIVMTMTALAFRVWRRDFEARHELRRRLLEKMTSEEVARLLETEEGRRSITALFSGEERSGMAGATGRGVTLLLIGMALAISGVMSHLQLVGTAGVIAIAGGIGQLVTAWLIGRERRT
jgi:uncharacterized paraquat-inducible protein A